MKNIMISDMPSDEVLHQAAAGNTRDLADWIEQNKSLGQVPYELIAELVRNSKGCKKNIYISEVKDLQYSYSVNEAGQEEKYISKQTGSLLYFFKSAANKPGRPKTLETTNMHNKIYEDYKNRSKKSADIAVSELAKKYSKAESTIQDIIKDEGKKRRRNEERQKELKNILMRLRRPKFKKKPDET